MKSSTALAASCLALSAFLVTVSAVAQDNPAPTRGRVDANGMPTDRSTPAEHAATAVLNDQISGDNVKADSAADQDNAQYQAKQQNYQDQLQQNQAAQKQFQDQSASYENLRARYAAQRLAYHRATWPGRYTHWTLEDKDGLKGQRVEIVNGDRVGTVTDVAHSANGRVAALRVSLDNSKTVWIDQADIRFDRADGIVMTNLDRADLRQMADESL